MIHEKYQRGTDEFAYIEQVGADNYVMRVVKGDRQIKQMTFSSAVLDVCRKTIERSGGRRVE